jgi:hypothetical protein
MQLCLLAGTAFVTLHAALFLHDQRVWPWVQLWVPACRNGLNGLGCSSACLQEQRLWIWVQLYCLQERNGPGCSFDACRN